MGGAAWAGALNLTGEGEIESGRVCTGGVEICLAEDEGGVRLFPEDDMIVLLRGEIRVVPFGGEEGEVAEVGETGGLVDEVLRRLARRSAGEEGADIERGRVEPIVLCGTEPAGAAVDDAVVDPTLDIATGLGAVVAAWGLVVVVVAGLLIIVLAGLDIPKLDADDLGGEVVVVADLVGGDVEVLGGEVDDDAAALEAAGLPDASLLGGDDIGLGGGPVAGLGGGPVEIVERGRELGLDVVDEEGEIIADLALPAPVVEELFKA